MLFSFRAHNRHTVRLRLTAKPHWHNPEGTAVGFGEAVGGATVQATQAVVTTAVGTREAIGSAACYAGQTVVDTAISAGGTIGNVAIQATQTFGYAFGSEQALKSGISYAAKAGLSLVPVAGAVVGAGTNAAILYALGYGACRFYETKLDMVPLLQGT